MHPTNRPAVLTVLLDTGIFSHSEFGACATDRKELSWGSWHQSIFVHGVRRESLHANVEYQSQIDVLPTVGRLIREKRIEAYEYREIWCERMRRRASVPFGNALRDCKVSTCNSPLDRAKFIRTTDFIAYWSKGGKKDRKGGRAASSASQLSFLNWVCSLDTKTVDVLIAHADEIGLTDFDVGSLREISWFQFLCQKCQTPENYPDIFHLWTAQRNGLDVFLTLERRFSEFVSRIKAAQKIKIRTQVLRPLDLVRKLGIKRLDPVPLDENRFYHLHELG